MYASWSQLLPVWILWHHMVTLLLHNKCYCLITVTLQAWKCSKMAANRTRTLCFSIVWVINNYSPKWRWIVVDICRAAVARWISTTFTDTEVNNCFSFYHTSWINSGPKSNFIWDNIPTKAILFFFRCSEVNSTWLITSELANQRARKVLFTCVVYTNLENNQCWK